MRTLLLVVLLLACNAAKADEYGTTDSGRRVLLKDDGTWIDADKATPAPNGGNAATEQVIQDKCRSEWADDFGMREFCERQQRDALHALAMGKPRDISQDQYAIVSKKCAAKWPDDFGMRLGCERQQFEVIRELDLGRSGP